MIVVGLSKYAKGYAVLLCRQLQADVDQIESNEPLLQVGIEYNESEVSTSDETRWYRCTQAIHENGQNLDLILGNGVSN